VIGQRIGQYEITALLGEGGMATVYRAHQESMRRDVAIKVIKVGLNEQAEFMTRFIREVQTVAALSHPHILKVFDYGEFNGAAYLVMELLTGGSLAQIIKRGPMPITMVRRVVEHITSALDYAHGTGIVHRDLKPQNVLLDSQGNAFLTDFGIAKVLREKTQITQTGTVMGTPAYMSPEQWQGGSIDGRADLYALGVMIFEMLSGSLPFEGDTPFSLMHMHIYQPPRRLVRPDLPPGVEYVIQRALAKDRNQRFQTGAELMDALNAALSGQVQAPPAPFITPPPPPAYNASPLYTAPQTAPQYYTPTPLVPTLSSDQRARRTGRGGLIAMLGVIALALVVVLILVIRGATSPESPGSSGVPVAPATHTVLPGSLAASAVVLLPTNTATETATPTATPTLTFTATATFTVTDTATTTITLSPVPPTLTPTTSLTITEPFTPTSTPNLELTVQAALQGTTTNVARITQAVQTAQAELLLGLTQTAASWTSTPTNTSTQIPRPSNTPRPSSTPYPTATIYTGPPVLRVGIQARVYVEDEGLKLRSGAGVNYRILENLPSGTIVTIIGDSKRSSDGLVWWLVRSPVGNEGWAVEGADGITTLIPLQ